DVTLVPMPGRGWLLLEVVASLLVASDGFNRQLQWDRHLYVRLLRMLGASMILSDTVEGKAIQYALSFFSPGTVSGEQHNSTLCFE
ncbi:unnamed protein product, partial [Symbiodinium microadriaticum]